MSLITIKLSRKYGFGLQIKAGLINFKITLYKDLPIEVTNGLQNKCQDGMHVIFLDYDTSLYNEQLIPELKSLQKNYKLSDFYIFKSSQKEGSYHAICLDKLTAREWMNLLEDSSVDKNYKLAPLIINTKSWVLRFTTKGDSKIPVHIRTLISPYQEREKSRPHALFLHYYYGISIKGLKNLDKNTIISLVRYSTLNYLRKGSKEAQE